MIGIVASRLVERFGRPVVLIAGEGDRWKGSGRSIPSFDLHAGLSACADHLERFGGHRAAAGLTIRPEELEPLRRRLRRRTPMPSSTRTTSRPSPGSTRSSRRRRSRSTSPRELERLAPFGLGNPDVTLLVAGCEAVDSLDGRRGQAPAVPRAPERARRRQRDRLRPRRAARAPASRRALRRRLPAQAEPLERHGRHRSSSCAACSTRRRAYEALRTWLARALAGGRGRLDARGPPDLRRARARATRPGSGSCSSRRPSACCSSTVGR